MRVISGKYKGKILKGFDIDGTRPTMDRVKESVFGIIQNNIKDSIVLDLFAGSGSLGIEAISNGANKCYFVDNNDIVIKVLKENLNNIDNFELIKNNYSNYLDNCKIKFDIIFLDPPYKLCLIQDCLNKIIEKSLLNDNGIIVCEYENEQFDVNLKLIKEKQYGTKNIKIYQKNKTVS